MALLKREFLQLAHHFEGTLGLAGWFYSNKLDGWRAFWDGGITRGLATTEVPWANTARESHYIVAPRATGLWSRYGRPINAPDWFLDQLPNHPLDGELWIDRNCFQDIMSITRRLDPGPGWQRVKYMIFEAPSYREVFADGEIRIKKKFEKIFRGFDVWAISHAKTTDNRFLRGGKNFVQTIELLQNIQWGSHVCLHEQVRLPYCPTRAPQEAARLAAEEVERGGEGGMVRNPSSFWVPKRTRTMLKVKPYKDDEATVVGYYYGKQTDLGSKLLGLMGSVEVHWKGVRFRMSGFTDEERRLKVKDGSFEEAFQYGLNHAGESVPDNIENPLFPRGKQITFQYRELTDDGIPKEARYLRVRPEE